MQLTLRILTYRNQPVPPAPAVAFGAEGGSIGRSLENALVLDDPSKYISRVHARVLVQDGAFVLEDMGSNASVVNDRPLGKGKQVALAHGDRVLIGDYLLQAVVDATAAAPLLAPAPANNPALPLFEPPPPAAPPQLPPLDSLQAQPATVPRSQGQAPAAAQFAGAAPAFLDPLAGASILDVAPGQQRGTADPLGLNLFAPAPGASHPPRAAESDHVSPELAAMPRSAALPGPAVQPATAPRPGMFAIPNDYDPLADFFPSAAAGTATVASAPAAFAPAATIPVAPPVTAQAAPLAAALAAPALQAAPAAAAPVAVASDSDKLAALLRGLGLPDLKLQRPPVEIAETVGAMLREATAGTIDVLMARAATKKESRIEMTMLSVRANNPLKFFPNAHGALTQMLTSNLPGYMPPVEAMAGAFDDLRAHELAVIAGMRAALSAVLERFDPARIEARLAEPTVMDKMLSSGRKAKMWDRLVELYGEIAREADDDLQRLYGEKFSEAYEEQVARLRSARQ
ncbi:type VI secretion system-associated FHA domain protein TagH [Massilia aerilata]|uniref:Type VI secretion system-associated FHA domain protein TagH n=1 Tax=Massilia aerilata TaxID=453817 RepID=A0ABW0RW19_9BURK